MIKIQRFLECIKIDIEYWNNFIFTKFDLRLVDSLINCSIRICGARNIQWIVTSIGIQNNTTISQNYIKITWLICSTITLAVEANGPISYNHQTLVIIRNENFQLQNFKYKNTN